VSAQTVPETPKQDDVWEGVSYHAIYVVGLRVFYKEAGRAGCH